jgi:membrane protease YdiL (CAAX protease family)
MRAAASYDFITIFFLVWVLLYLPLLAWFGYRRLQQGRTLPPKIDRLRLGILFTVFSTVFALAAADSTRIQLSYRLSALDLSCSAVLSTLVILSANQHREKADHSLLERIRLLYAPTSAIEWRWAVLGGFCAGVGEEIVYRGVLYQLLGRLTSSGFLAVLICVFIFAVSHLPQGRRGVFGVASLGFILHLLYFWSYSLAMPMIVHAAYDITIFTVMYRHERRLAMAPVTVENGKTTPLTDLSR